MKEFDKFQKIYNDSGKEKFLQIMFTLLDLELPKNTENINLHFYPKKNIITIKNNKNMDYTLYMYDKYLIFSIRKKKYKTETVYSYAFKPYQTTVYFNGFNSTIALQETRLDNIKSRRLISYVDNYADNESQNPEFEKEILEFNGKNVECTYNYQNSGRQNQTYKAMNMEDCLYYYHFQTFPNDPDNSHTSYLEVASTTNVPKLNIIDRLNEEESLGDVISKPFPNILINGAVKNNGVTPNFQYQIKIRKDSSLTISCLERNLDEFSEEKKEKTILPSTKGELTVAELFRIIDILRCMLPESLLGKIIIELQNIQNHITNRNKNMKVGDFLDSILNSYSDFNTLARDILKNLSTYEKFIELIIQNQKESNQEQLIKRIN